MKYRPLFASQFLPPLSRGCRVSSVYHALALATTGESTLSSIGRTHSRAQRKAALQRGWRAFATQKPADSNGYPDQGDVTLIQDAIEPGLPAPRLVDTDFPEMVWNRIGKDAVSIATDTGAVPASDALRKYGGAVAHQFVAYKRMTVNGDRRVKVIDSRHGHSNTYTGHWVKWSSLKKAAKAVSLRFGGVAGGRIFAELYPIGGWTRERLTTKSLVEEVADITQRLRKVRDDRDVAVNRIIGLVDDLANATAALANAKAAAHESAHVKAIEYHEDQRAEGP